MNNEHSLGVGIGFREPFLGELFLNQDRVDFLEVIAEHYLDATWQKKEELELLQAHFPIVPHALNLSIGSAEGIDTNYLKKIAKLNAIELLIKSIQRSESPSILLPKPSIAIWLRLSRSGKLKHFIF
jgi:uncharacterized protein (UPF0276 family)